MRSEHVSTAVETRVVAVAGNPNCGKTTLFNGLTGGRQRVGNWPGVTVEKKEGRARIGGMDLRFVDLPGIYSLSAYSEDERVARDYLLSGEVELVINIVDATNLERNLYLTTHLLEMKVPVLVVLNMMDLAVRQDTQIDVELLEKTLGCPVVGISAIKSRDIDRVKEVLTAALNAPSAPNSATPEYPNEIDETVQRWELLLQDLAGRMKTDSRWLALKLLEADDWITDAVTASGAVSEKEIEEAQFHIQKTLKEPADIVLADYRYGFIHGLTRKVMRRRRNRISATDRADKIVMNRVLGIPIFLAVMYLVFWITINVGGAFIDFFDILFGTVFVDGLGALLAMIGTPEWLITIAAGGIGAGIQTVATFIPIIFTMFLMLSLLEDSGYMARAAFVMDRFMRWIGLPGKSFVPMIVGFGCTIPAVMATRTLENRKDRFMTVFMTPFMSCGARLPVYALFAAAFFPATAGSVVFSIYLVGIVLAVLTGLLLKNTLFRGEASPFIMELPPYHAPRLRHIMAHTWNRLKIFMRRAGLVIVIVVAVLGFLNSLGTDGSFGNEDTGVSVLSRIGKTITPVFRPMGIEQDNWPATVAIFTGLFAKEAVVGTLNSLYSQIDAATAAEEGVEEEPFRFWDGIVKAFASIPEGLAGIFGALTDPVGTGMISGDEEAVAGEVEADTRVFTAMRSYFSFGGPQAYAYLLFILIYFPCVAALGVILREIGAGYGWLSIAYLTVLAWIVATLYFQIAVARQLLWIAVPLAMLAGIYGLFRLIGSRTRPLAIGHR
jgi:ferrous iron transport protein B